MLPKEKIEKLKNELKGQSMKDLAAKLNVSQSMIFKVLRYETHNDLIIEGLIEMRNALRAKTKKLADRI